MEYVADRVHLIRYEDLVTQPQPVLETLGRWLGVDPTSFRSQMIQRGGGIGVHREDLHPHAHNQRLTLLFGAVRRVQ
ncbi:hypothetical protein ACFLXQ_07315 [Chloroflexota bacterium]